MLDHGFVGNFGNKTKCSLGANHQVLNHFKRIVEINQSIQAVASRIFHPELVDNPVCEFIIRLDLGYHVSYFMNELRVCLPELFPAFGISGIEQRTICKDDAH